MNAIHFIRLKSDSSSRIDLSRAGSLAALVLACSLISLSCLSPSFAASAVEATGDEGTFDVLNQGRLSPIVLIQQAGGRPTLSVRRTPREYPSAAGGGISEFSNGDFAAGLAGWAASQSGGAAAPGAATAEAGGAKLSEGDSFLVTLEQSFTVPDFFAEIALTVSLDPGFDRGSDFIPDAFEVSILDGADRPLLLSWDPQATSGFNLGEDGTAHLAEGVAWDGSRLRIRLDGAPAGISATLYFDLIGADADVGSALRLDDVELVESAPPDSFRRGDVDGDGRVTSGDADRLLDYLLRAGPLPRDCAGNPSLDAADANDNEKITVADVFAIRAAAAGEVLPAPSGACGLDPNNDAGGFGGVDPAYRIAAGEPIYLGSLLDEDPKIAVPILLDAPGPVIGLSLILEFDPEALTPFDPDSGDPPAVLGPAGAEVASIVEGSRILFIFLPPSGGEGILEGDPGSLRQVGSIFFLIRRTSTVRPFDWPAEAAAGGFTHSATVIDGDFRDHRPDVAVVAKGFLRGDSSGDGTVDLTDAVYTLGFLFLGQEAPGCLDAADADDNAGLEITDPIYTLEYLFLGGDPIAPPFPGCGLDLGADDLLGCEACSCGPAGAGPPCE